MDLAYIAPTCHLNRISAKGGVLLALAHLIDDKGHNNYARFHRGKAEQGYRVICDNGLFEGAQVDTESLLRRAGAINAQVVCAPDVLYDSGNTIKAFKQFIRAKQDAGMVFDVMGIPQADNPADWWECFRFMEMSSDCNLVGLSILSIPRAFNVFLGKSGITAARMHIIQQLYNYEIFLGRKITPCHLLGLGDHLGDITLARRLLPSTIISNDSSSAYIHGRDGIRYSQLGTLPGGKNPEKVDFGIQEKLTTEQLEAIRHNMHVAYSLANQRWLS